jgi:hypothetical protein
VTELSAEWLTLPDVAAQLGESMSRVRRLIEDRHLGMQGVFGARSELM